MSNINKNINKVSKALKAKGMMPLIDQAQFYGDDGRPITKYIVHYGDPNPHHKNNDVYAETYSKVELLKILVKVLKEGAVDG